MYFSLIYAIQKNNNFCISDEVKNKNNDNICFILLLVFLQLLYYKKVEILFLSLLFLAFRRIGND